MDDPRDRLLALAGPHEATLRRRLPALVADGRRWAAPVADQLTDTLYGRLTIAVALLAPDAADADLAWLVRYSIWTFLLDARIDDASGDAPETAAAAVADLFAGRRDPSDGDFFHTALVELAGQLRDRDRRGDLYAGFTRALTDAAAAGVEQARLNRAVAAGAPLPDADTYLHAAARHILYESVMMGLLVFAGDGVLTPAVTDAMPSACRAVRLANDLRTVAKDDAEGNPNILRLTAPDGRPYTPQAVTAMIAAQVDTHLRALRALPDDLRATRTVLANALRVSIGLYQITDLQFDLDTPAGR